MNKFAYIILFVLIIAVSGMYFYVQNKNIIIESKFISVFDYLNKDRYITILNDSDETLINENAHLPAEELIKRYKLFYALSDNERFIKTARVLNFKDRSFTKIKKAPNTSAYLIALDKSDAVCFLVARKDLVKTNDVYKATKFAYIKNFDFTQSCDTKKLYSFDTQNLRLFNHPSFNAKSKILLFNAVTKEYNGSGLPKNWGIYAINFTNNKFTKITNGLFPNWIDEDEFIYLSEEGLKVFNTNTLNSKLIYRFNKSSISTPISYAKDAQTIVWSLPFKNKIYKLKLVFKDKNVLGAKKVSEIDGVFIDPIISNDARFIIYKKQDPRLWYAFKSNKLHFAIFDMLSNSNVAYTLPSIQGKKIVYSMTFLHFINN